LLFKDELTDRGELKLISSRFKLFLPPQNCL